MRNVFWQSQPPYFYCTGVSASDVSDFGYSLFFNEPSGLVIRFIRGGKIQTVDSMHDEISAALQFPWYYGENWAAFDECINDLEWLPGKAYLLIFTDAEQLLTKEDDEVFATLVRILNDAAAVWNRQVETEEQMRSFAPFHVIFQSSDKERFISRLQLAGFSCAELDLSAH